MTMTPERWQQISDALDEAFRLSGDERAPYLAGLAEKDPELHREVESLLASHRDADTNFLKTPLSRPLLEPNLAEPSVSLLGKRIGVACRIL